MRYFIYLSLIFSASLHAGSIHKWIDEDGNVHYGDSPPISTTTKQVKVIGAPSDPGKALPRLGTGAEEATDTAPDQPESSASEDPAQIACTEAKKDLKVIKSSNRVKLKSADGSTRYMTQEEIAERRKNAEEDVKKYCQ